MKIIRKICEQIAWYVVFPPLEMLVRFALSFRPFKSYMYKKRGLDWLKMCRDIAENKGEYLPELSNEIRNDPGKVFSYIYQKNIWGNKESASGPGSTEKETASIRQQLPEIVQKYGIKTFLDIPCGDWRWMSRTSLGVEHYIGGDIVPEIVDNNEKLYGNDVRSFRVIDLINSELPQGDLLLCRDCLVHLSYEHIQRFLDHLHRSEIRYLLATTFVDDRRTNSDITTGNWRALNLEANPFHFPKPLEVILENSSERHGQDFDKAIALWEVARLPKKIIQTMESNDN